MKYKMKSRKITAFLLICVLIAGMLSVYSTTVSARWLNTMSISCDFSFIGRTAICSGDVDAYSGSIISGTLTLQKKNGSSWDYVTSWSKNSSTTSLAIDGTHTVDSAGTYRVVLTATVTRNGIPENVSVTSSEKSCS